LIHFYKSYRKVELTKLRKSVHVYSAGTSTHAADSLIKVCPTTAVCDLQTNHFEKAPDTSGDIFGASLELL
jgi:hypothetical protein